MNEKNILHSIDVINICQKNCIDSPASLDHFIDVQHLLQKYDTYIHQIPILTNMELTNLLETQAQRFEHDADVKKTENTDILKNIIDVFTSEDVINLIADKLINKKL